VYSYLCCGWNRHSTAIAFLWTAIAGCFCLPGRLFCYSITGYQMGVCHSVTWLQNAHSIAVLSSCRFHSISMLITEISITWWMAACSFMVYIVTLSVAQNIKCWMIGLLVDSYWKGCVRKKRWSDLRYYSNFCVEGLRKLQTSSVRIVSVLSRLKAITSQIQVGNVTSLANFLCRVLTS
jgi:hypothetical protein